MLTGFNGQLFYGLIGENNTRYVGASNSRGSHKCTSWWMSNYCKMQHENNPKCCVGDSINYNETETSLSLTQLRFGWYMIICETEMEAVH